LFLFKNGPPQIQNTTDAARGEAFRLNESEVHMGITKKREKGSALAG
jgi:hypothetical protein